MFENIGLSFQGIWNHKLRSFLTMLGIIIGIAAIITIVSTITGTNEQIKQNLVGAGNNVVTIRLRQNGNDVDMQYTNLPQTISVITEETRRELEDLDGVESASLYTAREWTEGIFFGKTQFNGRLYGIDLSYFTVNGYSVINGRGFIEKDCEEKRKCAIVDEKVATSLFAGINPVGQTIEIMKEPFVIVGVVAKNSGNGPTINSLSDYYMYTDTSAGSMFVPYAAWPIIYRYDEPQSVAIKAYSTDDMTKAGKNAADYLTKSQIHGTDEFAYEANNLMEQAEELQKLTAATNNQLIWIAGISLLVGGIGVMNIMLVSVTERTREIGLKKAIGARRNRILWQFLTEAAVLTSLGGLLGVGCGVGLAYMLASVMGTPVAISIPACVIAVVFSMLIGIIFGLVPAVKASKLNPIDALRFE